MHRNQNEHFDKLFSTGKVELWKETLNIFIITSSDFNLQQDIKSNKIGDKCPCGIPNSHCNLDTSQCECENGFVETPDKLRCIKSIVPLDQPCEMNEQCVKFDQHAVCHESTCRCLKNFAQHDKSCRALVKVGEKCESNVQCSSNTSNVSCMDHECTCDKFFVSSTDGNVS